MTVVPRPFNRVVLCKPSGGFVDLLRQIGLCLEYAALHERVVLVDGEHRLCGLHDSFSNYFESEEQTLRLSKPDYEVLNLQTSLPEALAGRLDSFYASWKENAYVDSQSNEVLNFDRNKEHDADVLVHVWENTGGVKQSLLALSKIKLNDAVRQYVIEKISALRSGGYLAIHVRNTDYKTNYEEFFSEIHAQVSGKKLLICSDDHNCIQFAKKFFAESEVFTLVDIPDLNGGALHLATGINRYQFNIDMLVDLCALALADQVLYSKISRNYLSGFTRLALTLNDNKKLIHEFVGSPFTVK